jgi:hypothetical protein
MSFTSADFQYLAEAANRIDPDRIYRNDFAPGQLTPLGSMDGLRDKVANIFGEPEPEPQVRPNDPPCPPR